MVTDAHKPNGKDHSILKSKSSKILTAAFILMAVFALKLVYTGANIHAFSKKYFATKSDVAIILGHASWNGEISPNFKGRMDHAITLYKQGIVKYLLITGGIAKESRLSDSQVAKLYAIRHGIPDTVIFLEESSGTTFENLAFAKPIIDEKGWNSILLVSDPLHMKRAIKIAAKCDIRCLPSPTQNSRDKNLIRRNRSLIYEVLAYHRNWILRQL